MKQAQPYRVLLVDDEPMILRSLKVALPWEAMGMEVVGQAENGSDALARMEALRPHLVVTDIRMPKMDGLTYLRLASERYPDTRFIMLSGFGEFEYVREALRSGAVDYLLKPIDHEELERVLRQAKEQLDDDRERKRQTDTLHRSVQGLSSLVRERLVSSMLEGTGEPYDRLYWLQGWEFEAPYTMFLILLDDPTAALDSWSGSERKLWNFAVHNVVSEYGEGHGLVTAFPFHNGEWVLLVNRVDLEAGLQMGEELVALIRRYTKLSCSVGVSGPAEGIDALHDCYRSVQHALAARFTGGKGSVYHAKAGDGGAERGRRLLQLTAWEERLSETVAVFQPETLEELFRQWTRELKDQRVKQAEAAAWMIELTVGAARRLSDLFGEVDLPLPDLISRIPQTVTLEEMASLVAGAFRSVQRQLALGAAREKDRRSIQRAIDYADKQFHRDLSIDEAAEYVGLSASHFCVLFKKETGYTFLEYLTKRRVELARTLLRRPDAKVQRIAQLVGYSDPKYFTQVFKKLTGKTPKDYRASLGVAALPEGAEQPCTS